MAKEIRLLRADEIEVRVGTVKKDQTGKVIGCSLLLYKDARCDMNILDETFGANMWQREHKSLDGTIYCGVGINYGTIETPYWVWKWDAGSQSNTEPEKGAASDSFKRACVNATGCGRELYTAPFIWLKEFGSDGIYAKWRVSEIGYNEKREINKLTIIDSKSGAVVYTYGTRKSAPATATAPASAPAPTTEEANIDIAKSYLAGNEAAHNYFVSEINKTREGSGKRKYENAEDFDEMDWLYVYATLKKNNKI